MNKTDKIICLVIYLVALGLLYSTSMLGTHLVGTDIQSEYWVAKHDYNGWDIQYPHLYNSSVSTAVVAPFLSKLLHLDLVWIFKAIYPAFFALVPVLLYLVYRKFLDRWQAGLSVAFFMAVPMFFLELPQLPRQELAEVFLVLMLLALVSDWKQRIKIPIIFTCVIAATLCHWTIGLVCVVYLTGMILALIIFRKWSLFENRKTNLLMLAGIVIVCLPGTYFYGKNIASGLPIKGVSNLLPVLETAQEHIEYGNDKIVETTATTENGTQIQSEETVKQSYLYAQETTIRTAVGLDFFEASIWGKIFRVIQFLTQAAILWGCIYLLFNHKKFQIPAKFIAGIGISVGILLACIFIPNFSGLLGMTRFYHITLFFLAPMLVIGIGRRYWALGLITVYFLFTSGIVYEATKSNTIDRFDIPYSIGLSAERTGIVGIFTDDDVKCAEWLGENTDGKSPIVADYDGFTLLQGYLEPYHQLREVYFWNVEIPKDSYVFITEWNTEHGKMVYHGGDAGLRSYLDLPEEIDGKQIVFQSGKAKIYK